LIRLNQHHLGKLEKGSRTYHEKRIQEIAGRLDGFPSHLSLRDQGLFAIGYYHQRQDLFTRKADKSENKE
jgi:CRISPR-associated protein Csd1